jgi:hypothetical protein
MVQGLDITLQRNKVLTICVLEARTDESFPGGGGHPALGRERMSCWPGCTSLTALGYTANLDPCTVWNVNARPVL